MRIIAASAALFLACAACWAGTDRATILADRISYLKGGRSLIASGHVEVYFQNYLLQAGELHYTDGVMEADGPLTLTDGSGTVAVGEYGQLDETLKTAILRGVEILLDGRLHLAAEQLETENARYILLRNVVMTTCRTCADAKTPIWHFRSRSVALDRQEELVYLRHATFVLGKTPVFALPRLRLPAATAKRKSGFLAPELNFSSKRGFTAGVPYFQTLGDHADITVTPHINSDVYSYLEFEARRRFRRGLFDVSGTLALGSNADPKSKGHVTVAGGLNLGAGYDLRFSGTKLSNSGYFEEYGLNDDETLTNAVGVTRRGTDTYFEAESSQIVLLKNEETGRTRPRMIHEAFWRAVTSPPGIGGAAGLDLSVLWFDREVGGPERPRQVSRLSASADWNRRWNTESGLVLTYSAAASADRYGIESETGDDFARLSGVTAVDFSMPLSRHANARSEFMEPFIQFVWSPEIRGAAAPNEDSRFVEFDVASLRSLDRFPGRDRSESGARVNTGIRHTRSVADSHDFELVLGRVFRSDESGQFTDASGLAGRVSDIVASAELRLDSGLGFEQSLTTDDSLNVSAASSRLSYDSGSFGLDLGYTSIDQDSAEGMTGDTDSVVAGVSMGLMDGWELASDVRLDLDRKAKSDLGLGLAYNHQCLAFSARLQRTLRTESERETANEITFLFSLGSLTGPSHTSPAGCVGS